MADFNVAMFQSQSPMLNISIDEADKLVAGMKVLGFPIQGVVSNAIGPNGHFTEAELVSMGAPKDVPLYLHLQVTDSNPPGFRLFTASLVGKWWSEGTTGLMEICADFADTKTGDSASAYLANCLMNSVEFKTFLKAHGIG